MAKIFRCQARLSLPTPYRNLFSVKLLSKTKYMILIKYIISIHEIIKIVQ